MLERSGLPVAVLLAFRTLARIAAESGEARAIELLEGLDAVGVQRGLPRLRVASLAEQVMLHARSHRAEICRGLMARIEKVLAAEDEARRPLLHRSTEIYRDLAEGHAAIAARDWKAALPPFERAGATAQAARRNRLYIETLACRTLATHQRGEDATALAREAAEMAKVYGQPGALDAAHPAAADAIERILSRSPAEAPAAAARPQAAPAEAEPRYVARSTALTPKEREVLELLARNLSNKEIGLTMEIHEDTVKWHVKNLFAKLSAGTRKQVVQRALLTGMLTPAE